MVQQAAFVRASLTPQRIGSISGRIFSHTERPRFLGAPCRRRESNPHEHKAHCALNAARLPVPPLRRRAILPRGTDITRKLMIAVGHTKFIGGRGASMGA